MHTKRWLQGGALVSSVTLLVSWVAWRAAGSPLPGVLRSAPPQVSSPPKEQPAAGSRRIIAGTKSAAVVMADDVVQGQGLPRKATGALQPGARKPVPPAKAEAKPAKGTRSRVTAAGTKSAILVDPDLLVVPKPKVVKRMPPNLDPIDRRRRTVSPTGRVLPEEPVPQSAGPPPRQAAGP
jgi:hypothetical protein